MKNSKKDNSYPKLLLDKNAGFTLVELMVVVAIIGILVAIAVPTYNSNTEAAKIAMDQANLRILNFATVNYKIAEEIVDNDIFSGTNDDQERMQLLVDNNYLSGIPEPQSKDTNFYWSIEAQKWYFDGLLISKPPKNSMIFSQLSKDDFIFNSWGGGGGGTWTVDENGLFTTGANGNDLLFINNNKSEYTLTTSFKLNENASNHGGLGLFFETALNSDDENRDTGYILQFDRGYSEVIIRQRINGSESNDNILVRIGDRSTSDHKNDMIPYKDNNDWWEKDHNLSLTVKESVPGKKLISVTLNDNEILSEFEIESDIDPANNFTGYRAWVDAPATVYDLNIE